MAKIKVGDKAPVFEAKTYNAGKINLSELIGKQKIVLIFSRYFGCPICLLDLEELVKRQKEIEDKGAKILYITQSCKEIAEKTIKEKTITFPVIPSPQEDKKTFTFYSLYGLGMMSMGAISKVPGKLNAAKKAGISHGEYEGWEKQSPGQFIIDEKGIIIQAKKSWLDIDNILSVL